MKKLFSNSILPLVFFSLAISSCTKDGELDLKGAPPPIKVTVTFETTSGVVVTVPNAETISGSSSMPYKIEFETLNDCYGTWSYSVDGPADAKYSAFFSGSNAITFMPTTKGTYKIAITNKCDCGVSATVTLTIIVS